MVHGLERVEQSGGVDFWTVKSDFNAMLLFMKCTAYWVLL